MCAREYLVILDADDWYAENGLETLANLLDKSESSIVFGGIVRVQNERKELFSPAYVEKDIIDRPISELPYDFFNWMGPQGNMMRTSVVIEHNLHFVNQRVADDVTFFYQILRYSKTISQTKELTIYLNRDEDNMSLSKTVNETF
ncbi:glycosyltransferase [Lactococcus garvieae]